MPSIPTRVVCLWLLVAAGCTCRERALEPVPAFIRVTPAQLDFGRLGVGQVGSNTVEVINSGKAPIEGTWSLRGEAFLSDDGNPSRAAVGSTVMAIRCAPSSVGIFDGELVISLAGFEPISVPLACEGVASPDCVASGPCRVSSWDVAAGRCVEHDQPEGLSCAGHDVCLLDATCRAGRCEGVLRDCADADPCTADTCDPSRGCEHHGPIACPGAGPCRVGFCAAGTGCTLVDAEDGVPCGARRSCTLADVCISGQCVERDPPDGFTCAAGGPCGGAGTCVYDVCQPSPITAPLQPSWTLAVPQPDGGPPEMWSDLFADRDGALAVSSYFKSPPRLRANTAAPLQLASAARRCISWLGWVVCGDLPATRDAPVSAIDTVTGQTVWTFSGAAAAIPEFVGTGVDFFTARLAVLNENELLVLYESRTLSMEGVDPRCRNFGMVLLDRQGQYLRSLFLTDPIFGTCNHPHSYGVAVDAQSNLYLAFTPSDADNPATSLTGTMVFSFTPALQLRWRRFVPGLQGGELAVGDGLLFQEHSEEVRQAQTGNVVATLPLWFGLGVIGGGLALPTVPNVNLLVTQSTSTSQPGWQRRLVGNLGRAPLSIASWASPWGPREVALAFTSDGTQVWLEATELLTGAEAFTCPVNLPEVPALTAVTPGGLGVMLGTVPLGASLPVCENCDPKYARTQSSFGWLPVPGLQPSASAPWSAPWGNEGHSHHEGR